jgi:hypothetical protein
VLRYLFANLIDAELQRDKVARKKLELEASEKKKKSEEESARKAPLHITIPPLVHTVPSSTDTTPRPRGWDSALSLGIGLATPAPMYDPSPSRTSVMASGETDLNKYVI